MLNTDGLCPGCMHETHGERICSICGYDSSQGNGNAPEYLPVKSWLSDRYLVGRTLTIDCEGVAYIGFDNAANRPVLIKEYFPADIAHRNPDKTVTLNEGSGFAYNEGLMNFLEIGKKLIDSELQSIIPVFSVFEENGTAYRISERFSGITVEDFLVRNGGTLRWEQARPLFLPLIDTVIGLNSLGIVHGGISPETVLVGRDGRLRLNDLFIPSARKKEGDITPELYNGYAALEQYGVQALEVDGRTDVYGLCATLFRVLVGNSPIPANERVEHSGLSIPARLADELPRQVLVALANGLQIMPKDRTVTVEKFRNELVYGEIEESTRRTSAVKNSAEDLKNSKEDEKGGNAKYVVISAACTAAVFAVVAIILCLTVFRSQIFGGFEKEGFNNSENSFVTPSVASIGDVDSNAVESKILYSVPSFLGQYYSQIIENEEYSHFKFTIKDKTYSDKYAKGTVCVQSVNEGTQVEKETEIALTISLGTPEVKVPNVLGLDEMSAKVELLKQGFLYENIEVVEKYDEDSRPNTVLEQIPEANSTVSTEVIVRIYINSYDGVEDGGSDFDGAVIGSASNSLQSNKSNKKSN